MPLSKHGEAVCAQADEAFKAKENLDIFWQDTAEHFYPERADFTIEKTLGEDFASKVYASDPILFRRDFGNWIGAVLRPKGKDWFMPKVRDDKIDAMTSVRAYLESKAKATRNLLTDRKSQFTTAMVQADHDYVTFGNSVTSVEERNKKDGFLFRTWHLRDCAWRESYEGEVNTMFRKYKQSVRNLVSRKGYGWDIHPRLEERMRNQKGGDMINCIHALMPTIEYDYERKHTKFEFIGLHIDTENKHVMFEKECPEFYYAVSRWHRLAGSPYAFSPSVTCSIPDARTLQVMSWSIMEAGEKAVEPPLIATHEAILGGVNFQAGAITWVDKAYDERTGEVLRALELGGNPELGEALRQAMRSNLMEAWYLNKLYLPQEQGGEKMTAAEIARRDADFLRYAQPITDPAEQERNGSTLDLVMTMAMRLGYWGDLKKMPQELQGQDVDITYDNPIEDARRRAKANAFREVSELVALQVESGNTAPIQQLDQDKAFRDAISGVAPPDWLRDEDEAEEAIAEAEDEAAEAQGVAQGVEVADAGAKVIKAMQPPRGQEKMAA